MNPGYGPGIPTRVQSKGYGPGIWTSVGNRGTDQGYRPGV